MTLAGSGSAVHKTTKGPSRDPHIWWPVLATVLVFSLIFFVGLGFTGEGPLGFVESGRRAVSVSDQAPDTPGNSPNIPGEEGNGATGPDPSPQDPPEPPAEPVVDPFLGRADQVRGLYLTGYSAGNPGRLAELLEFASAGGLNAMVIDVKNDDGRLTFTSDITLAAEIGANTTAIADLPALVAQLTANDIYPIARVVVFCDPLLSRQRSEYGVQVNGTLWRDRRGMSWTNPHAREVWEYNVAVAVAAARAGFREIQFDYVRFPERGVPGVTQGVPMEERTGAIIGFLSYAQEVLSPLGVDVSADVFGLTTTVVDDMRIGQDYTAIASVVDYISPMVYPSHYSPGNYGLADPDASPYETVYNGMLKGREKTPALPVTVHRPWIQDFTLRHRYGVAEVEAQIQALADVGITSFLLWNPANRYTTGVDYSLIERPAKEPPVIEPEPEPESAPPPAERAPEPAPDPPGVGEEP